MPCIRTTASVPITKDMEKELTAGLASAVKECLGKNPEVMMTIFEGGVSMHRGCDISRDDPIVFVSFKFFGGDEEERFRAFDARVYELYHRMFGVAPQDCYRTYEVIAGWGKPANIFKVG